MQTVCPYCHARCQVPEQFLGHQVSCPNAACHRVFYVAATAGAASPPALVAAGAAPAARGGGSPPQPQPGAPLGPLPATPDPHAAAHPGQSVAAPAGLPQPSLGSDESFFGDLFAGKERQFQFSLLPGEELLDEIVIEHRLLFVVQRGVTRAVLTTQRVIYSATRTFTPLYWVLVALFPPLLLYYVARIAMNRSVAIPLESVDSVEKAHRPNALLFVLALVAAGLAVMIVNAVVQTAIDWPYSQFLVYPLEAFLGVAILVLLLKTRLVGIEVRSRSNRFAVRFSPTDSGISEQRFDSFVERLFGQLHRPAHGPVRPQAGG